VQEASTMPDERPAMSSLSKRIITGGILAAVVVAATLLLSNPWYSVLIATFVLVGAWEWSAMAGWASAAGRLAYAAGTFVVLVGTMWLMHSPTGTWAVLMASLAWWLTALAWVVRFQQGLPAAALDHPLVRIAVGWLILVPASGAVLRLHGFPDSGPWMVLYLVFLIASADSAAYFAGRRLGRRRLASKVSPGKSLEGVAAGLAAVATLAVVVALAFGLARPLQFVLLSLVTALASILGDLTESLVKRRAGVKDSGSIVPGHGGILDRLDSFTAATPIFVLGWLAQGGAL
jgi:phosphatidate cytidylyltransferase